MALIIEGPDNSGKSTLATRLSLTYNIPVIHSGGPGKPEDVEERIRLDIDRAQQRVIMDRSFIISDSVYSTCCRGKQLFDPVKQLRKLAKILEEDSHSLLIFCTADYATLTDLEGHKAKSYETEEHVAQVRNVADNIIQYYDRLAFSLVHFGNAIVCNPREDSEEIISYVGDILNEK